MSVENGLINNEQRKAFALIASKKFDEAERILRDKQEIVDDEVDEIVKRKLGIDVLETLIKQKEREVEELKDKKTFLEHGKYYGRKEGVFYKEKEKILSVYNLDIRGILKKRTDFEAEIWGSTKTIEAVKIIEKINDIVKESYKKIDKLKPEMLRKIESVEGVDFKSIGINNN